LDTNSKVEPFYTFQKKHKLYLLKQGRLTLFKYTLPYVFFIDIPFLNISTQVWDLTRKLVGLNTLGRCKH